MLRKGLLFFSALLVLCAPGWAAGIDGGLWVTSLAMDQVNGSIEAYNQANGTSLGALRLGLGGEGEFSLPAFWGITPVAGLRGLVATTGADREQVGASLVGGYLGGEVRLGGWSAGADIGVYRSTLSFAAGGYEGLVGWSAGLVGKAGYSVRFASLGLYVKLTLSWLPVSELHDSEGGLYASRTGAFLDFSGVGVSLGATWSF